LLFALRIRARLIDEAVVAAAAAAAVTMATM
jgi:hypothetical protein